MTWLSAIRWLHVLSAAAWFGQVVVINLILVPAAADMKQQERTRFLFGVFPKVFRLASVFSVTAVATGAIMLLYAFGLDWTPLFSTRYGAVLLTGATLATLLTLFHFFVEPRVGDMICAAKEQPDSNIDQQIVNLLNVVPKAGLAVIVTILLLMMIAAHGV